MKNNDFLIISTADWNSPIQTNKQYVSREIAKLGNRVLYVESLGVRKIQIKKKDFFRIFKRIINNLLIIKQKEKNIWVLSPILFPGATNKKIIFINRVIFNFNLFIAMKFLNFKKEYLWTYNPLTSLYLNIAKFKSSIYHAVDAIEHQPFMPKKHIEKQEIILSKKVDKIFVTSKNIINKLKKHNSNITYFGNVCDYDHFSKALTTNTENIPLDIKCINKPIIGFIGSISEYKLNYKLIHNVASSLKEINFVFIGPTDDSLNHSNLNRIKKLKNVYFLGYRKYKSLPSYCAYFDVAWLPLIHNNYTKSMFPMKFFEYLAAGLPVVATDLESIREFNKLVTITDDISKIKIAIIKALKNKDFNLKNRLSLAMENTYQKRTKKMLMELN
jgi:glycosyltransferase involved in cell wall biosynthesis|tara:strand:- start:625 stop:1785 length:1161 start_codon:yes stop_codon:yes gene_type:complete